MVKIELKKVDKKMTRLQTLRLRADFRTKQRIQKVLDEQKLKEMEREGITPEVMSQVRTARSDKKGTN